jgi:DNA-binding transcriptional LysR family regulator
MDDLLQLRCFVAAAETAHFGAAARRVALSPAAFSDRVRRLEADLGASLFERTSRHVALTDAGNRLLPHARRLLEGAHHCAAIARGDDRPLPYALTLGTRYELGVSWLCPALKPLADATPHRTIHLAMGDTGHLMHALERREVDAVVISARLAQPHLRYALLHEERYAFVCHPSLDWRPADSARFRLLDVSPDLPLFRYLADAQPDISWRFASHQYLGGIGAIRHQALAGAGVAVLPRYFIESDLAAGSLVEPLPDAALGADWFRLAWRAEHPREADLEALAVTLRAMPLR